MKYIKKSIINKLVFLGLIAFFWAGCKTKKEIPQPAPSLHGKTLLETDAFRKAIGGNINFQTLEILATADVDPPIGLGNLSLQIRLKKDKAIWVSVKAFGIESARLLITPDSVKIINRFQRSYIEKPFDFLHKYINSGINFYVLQNILIGNVDPELYANPPSAVTFNLDTLCVAGTFNNLAYSMTFDQRSKLIHMGLEDKLINQEANISYRDIWLDQGMLIPHTLMTSFEAEGVDNKMGLQLEYKDIIFNKTLSTPFEVPSSFIR